MRFDRQSPPFPSLQKVLLLLVTLSLQLCLTLGDRTYTDFKGETFTVADNAKPKIVVNAVGALSLFHLGLESSQLKAVFDHWAVRGSDLDIDDPSGEYSSAFETDPNAEEIEFLQTAVNLSPDDCTKQSAGCWWKFNTDDINSLNGDYDFIVLMRTGSGLVEKQEELGKNIIWLDDKFEPGRNCHDLGKYAVDDITSNENCYAMSMIDVVMEYEKFATFLGIEPTNQVTKEKKAMCDSAANFVAHTQTLHDKGIYAAPVTLRPNNGGTLNWQSTLNHPMLRTLEELGFPIVHPPNVDNPFDYVQYFISEWFVNCNAIDLALNRCTDSTSAYPIDLWLLDSRTYTVVDGNLEDTLLAFPDKALKAEQYTYWQFNDGAISYTNIARYLDHVREQTTGLERIHTDTLECADNLDVTSQSFVNRANGGMADVPGSGTYACRGNLQSLYAECPDDVVLDPTKAPSPPSSGLEIISIKKSLGLLFVCTALMYAGF